VISSFVVSCHGGSHFYGKPAVEEEIEHVDLPPVVIQIKAPDSLDD